MPNGVVSPPSNDAGLSAGSVGKSGGGNQKRNLIIGGVAALALGGIYLYAKSKSAASSGSGSTSEPTIVQPASNEDTTVGGFASSLSQQIAAEQSALIQAMQSAGNSSNVIPSEFPSKIAYGSASPSEFTQVGSITNGVYNGAEFGNANVPEYIDLYGVFNDQFNPSTLPNQYGPVGIFVPTQLLGQETGTGSSLNPRPANNP